MPRQLNALCLPDPEALGECLCCSEFMMYPPPQQFPLDVQGSSTTCTQLEFTSHHLEAAMRKGKKYH